MTPPEWVALAPFREYAHEGRAVRGIREDLRRAAGRAVDLTGRGPDSYHGDPVTTVPLDDSTDARATASVGVTSGAESGVVDEREPARDRAPATAGPSELDETASAPWWETLRRPVRAWESSGRRWLPGVWYPVVLWLFWRAAHLLLSLYQDPGHRWSNVFGAVLYYDGERYMQIANQGYFWPSRQDMPNTAFFPGVSWLAWAVDRIVHSNLLTAHVVATVTGLAAFIAVWGVSKAWKNDAVARKSVWLLALMPSSLFLWAFYSEGLFIALGAGAIWADRKQKHWLAAALILALSTTRSVAVLVPLVMIAARMYRQRRPDRWCAVYGAAALLGIVPVLYMMDWFTGDPLAFLKVQADWGRALSPPWTTLANGYLNLWPDPQTIMVPALVARNFDLWCVPIVAVGVGYAALARRARLPMESWMLGVALILLPLCSTSLASFNRFVFADWVIYPAYATMACRLPVPWRRAFWAVVVVMFSITTYHMVGRFTVDRFVG
jgi:hypothetical protein